VTGEARERALGSSRELLASLKLEEEHEASGGMLAAERVQVAEQQAAEAARFAEQLTRMVLDHVGELDEIISELAEGWSLERMPGIDRNILRLALAEIIYFDDIPVSVSIDEAVELAKEYSTEESGSFVNGILGAFVRSRGMAPIDR
jgi:N utilization substance protein B